MVIQVHNIQKRYRLHMDKIRRLAKNLWEKATREGHPRTWREVTAVLTDDIGMEAINRLHLSRNGTTDVISFGYRPMPGEGDRPTGEIFVNIQRAVERGTSRKTWGASKELALYIAHGFDHLTGGRDHTALRRAKMRRTELRWLEKAETLGLTSDLIC